MSSSAVGSNFDCVFPISSHDSKESGAKTDGTVVSVNFSNLALPLYRQKASTVGLSSLSSSAQVPRRKVKGKVALAIGTRNLGPSGSC